MKKFLLLPFVLIVMGFAFPAKQTLFIGKMVFDVKSGDSVPELYIEFRQHKKKIAGSAVNPDGTFRILTPSKEFDVYYRGIGINDTYIQTIKPTESDTVLLAFQIPKTYNEISSQAVCPKCAKHDKTIPVVYGLKSVTVDKHNPKPYTTYEGFGEKEIFDGGCTTSAYNARWFCKRDKIRF